LTIVDALDDKEYITDFDNLRVKELGGEADVLDDKEEEEFLTTIPSFPLSRTTLLLFRSGASRRLVAKLSSSKTMTKIRRVR
jgi:hypothetical protein